MAMIKSKRRRMKSLNWLWLATTLTGSHGLAAELLEKVADIPLPGGTTRFDYQSLDAAASLKTRGRMDIPCEVEGARVLRAAN